VIIIYLGLALLLGSIERPNLLFHQNGFTTALCRHRPRYVAIMNQLILTPYHFSPFVPKDEYCLCGTFPRLSRFKKAIAIS